MCKKDNNPNYTIIRNAVLKFFCGIFVLTVVFGGIQVYNCSKAKERQDCILKVLSDSETTLKSQNTYTIDYLDSSLIDSNFLNKRKSLQSRKKDDSFVSLEKINNDVELNTCQNIIRIIDNIEKLLHLEIAKIEEERTSLTLWIGIITVVFLIFTFYSLIKSDELVKTSRESMIEIREIEHTSRDTKKRIDKEFKECEEKIKSLEQKYESKYNDFHKEYEEKFNNLDEMNKNRFEKKFQEIDEKCQEINENVNTTKMEMKSLNEMNDKFKIFIESLPEQKAKDIQEKYLTISNDNEESPYAKELNTVDEDDNE
jgi:hypothetical protein